MLKNQVSIIIAVYRDVVALDLILKALKNQTYKKFEVIIAEDGQSEEMKEFIDTVNDLTIKHLSQEDIGWRKNKMLNKAIIESSCDYLIFIDGDCVPHEKFIEEHYNRRKNNFVLCGRRTEPGEKFSTLLREGKISIDMFFTSYLKNYFHLKKDEIRHYEEGIYCKQNSILEKLITIKSSRKEAHIVGCNWSCNKEDILKINGFDEDFELPTTGEDTDIERRMRHFGIKMISCRNFAIMLHLYHKKNFNQEIASKTLELMNTKSNQFVCKNGIMKHE